MGLVNGREEQEEGKIKILSSYDVSIPAMFREAPICKNRHFLIT
jgi:hypothetical protein